MTEAAGGWAAGATQRARARPASGLAIPLVDHIWRVRGAVPLDPALTPGEALARIAPLFEAPRTEVTLDGEALTYAKRNPAAQDPFATFTRGRLWIERAGAGAVLRFDLFSPALLLCFLAPLLFLGFSALAVTINTWEKAAEAAAPKDKDKKEADKPKAAPKLNPLDEFLGAPRPEDPAKKKKDKKKDEGRHSPQPGYYLAGIFFALHLVGRWLEPWLARRRFRTALASSGATEMTEPAASGT